MFPKMNISTIPNVPCPPTYFWESHFPEFRILVFYQIGITSCAYVFVSAHTIGLFITSDPEKYASFHQKIFWGFVCVIGVAAVLIHIVFGTILYKGVHENRTAYVAVWLTYVFICWIGAVVQLLFLTPWISINVVVAALSAALLLPAVYSLRIIQMRKVRDWTLNVHC